MGADRDIKETKTVSPDNQVTTNSYADVVNSEIDCYYKQYISYVMFNDSSNSLDWKVLASNDGTNYVEAQAEAAIGAAAKGSFASIAYYRYYKVQIKSTIGGSHATADLEGIAKGI